MLHNNYPIHNYTTKNTRPPAGQLLYSVFPSAAVKDVSTPDSSLHYPPQTQVLEPEVLYCDACFTQLDCTP